MINIEGENVDVNKAIVTKLIRINSNSKAALYVDSSNKCYKIIKNLAHYGVNYQLALEN